MTRFIIVAILSILYFLNPAQAEAQSLKSYSGKVKDGYNFWLSSPKKEAAGAEMKPLIVFLHGASLSGTNLNRVLRYGTLDAIKRGLRLDAYVVAPQSPGRGWQPRKVMNVVDYVLDHYADIDTTRIYVVGMSMGGYGTLDVVNAYPERVAAALAFCGGSTAKEFSGLSEVPVWIVHGTADRAVGVNESDRVVEALKQIDPETPRLIYDRIPGMNHTQPGKFFYIPSFYQWLFEHSLADSPRNAATGFRIDDELLRNAYRKLRQGKELITVVERREPITPPDKLPHPAGSGTLNAGSTKK